MSDESEAPEATEPPDVEAELARIRAERDAARAQLEQLSVAPPSRHLVRRITAAGLVAVSCLTFLTGGAGIWANRTLLDTDIWVERVGPLIDDPDVQAVISAEITTETMRLVDPQAFFEEVLPERGQLLAAPLSSAVEGFVGDQVDDVVASDAFATLWVGINEEAHAAAVKVLRGDAEAVQAGDETVTLNLVPAINSVLASITSASPELFGRSVDIPDIQVDEIPSSAIDKINEAFGTDLPPDFGQFTVYDDGQLKEVQDAIAFFDTLVWVSVVLFVLSTVGAIAVSVNRRRTLVQLAVIDVLILVLMRRAAITAQDQLLDLIRVDANLPAVRATTDAVLSGLFDGTRTLLWIFGILVVIAWVTGPSGRAGAVRSGTSSAAVSLTSAARDRGSDPATTAWIIRNRDALRIAGVVVAVVLLWSLSLSWFGAFVLLALVAGYQVLLARLGEPESPDGEPPAGGDPDVPTVEDASAPSASGT